MKKIIAGASISLLAVAATFAGAVPTGNTVGCPANQASSSSSLNKLMGGLAHGTERSTSSSASSSMAPADCTGGSGSIPPEAAAQSGTALTINGASFTANSAAASDTAVLKIKTKSNIKND